MPLIQVDIDRAVLEEKRQQLSEAIHQALVDTESMGIPEDDKFQVFRPRDAGELQFDPTYNSVDRQSLVLIQVLMVHRYPASAKREMFLNLTKQLVAIGIRPEDLLISIMENQYEDWLPGMSAEEFARVSES